MQKKFNAKGKVKDSGPGVAAPSNCRGWRWRHYLGLALRFCLSFGFKFRLGLGNGIELTD
jgi:hypothetical protein